MAQTCLCNQGSVCSARSRQHAQGNPCEQGLREIPLQASAEYVSCTALRGLAHHHRQPHRQRHRHHHQQTGFAGGPGSTKACPTKAVCVPRPGLVVMLREVFCEQGLHELP